MSTSSSIFNRAASFFKPKITSPLSNVKAGQPVIRGKVQQRVMVFADLRALGKSPSASSPQKNIATRSQSGAFTPKLGMSQAALIPAPNPNYNYPSICTVLSAFRPNEGTSTAIGVISANAQKMPLSLKDINKRWNKAYPHSLSEVSLKDPRLSSTTINKQNSALSTGLNASARVGIGAAAQPATFGETVALKKWQALSQKDIDYIYKENPELEGRVLGRQDNTIYF